MMTGRREFLKTAIGALLTAGPAEAGHYEQPVRAPRIRFAAIGLNHGHIYGQVETVIRGGGELVSFFAKEPDLAAAFAKRYPAAKLARSERDILEDRAIQLVVSASIPNERAPLGIEVMRHGKDFMVDKPGATTLDQLAHVRRVQADTKRIYSVLLERHEHRATARAAELVKAGAIGRVVQTLATGPHRMNPTNRPAWFFDRSKYGGILCDIASHHVDQFLFFTGTKDAEVVASQVGNLNHPQYPGLEDFGDVTLGGRGCSGYIRVDWLSPQGLTVFGDGRLTILGTDGYIEIRKTIDIAGRGTGGHVLLVDDKQARYIESSAVALTYGERLVDDVLNRTETAESQARAFLAMDVTLRAQRDARRIAALGGAE